MRVAEVVEADAFETCVLDVSLELLRETLGVERLGVFAAEDNVRVWLADPQNSAFKTPARSVLS